MGPPVIVPATCTKQQLLQLCELFDVTHEMLEPVAKLTRPPADQRPGADCRRAALAAFLTTVMPRQRNQVQVQHAG